LKVVEGAFGEDPALADMGEWLYETFSQDWLRSIKAGTFVVIIDSPDTDLMVLTNGDNPEASYLMSRANMQLIVEDEYGEAAGTED
jgi:hypothetical protein